MDKDENFQKALLEEIKAQRSSDPGEVWTIHELLSDAANLAEDLVKYGPGGPEVWNAALNLASTAHRIATEKDGHKAAED